MPKDTNFSIGTYRIDTSANPISDNGIINRGYADSRYVRKTKLTTFEWTWGYYGLNSTFRFPFRASGWPSTVRTDEVSSKTNIELRHITSDEEITKDEILSSTLVVGIRAVSASTHHDYELFNLPLTGKTALTLPTHISTNNITIPLEEEYWLGGILPPLNVLAFSIRVKLIGSFSGSPEVLCTFRLNEAGQYG